MQLTCHYYRDRKALLHRDEDDAEERRQADKEVDLIQLPYVACGGDVDQADDCCDYDGGEHDVWGVGEQGHEEEERHHHRRRHHHVRHGRLAPCVVVHSRAGEGA